MNEDDAYWCNHRDTILRLRDYKSNYQNGNHIVECSYKENYLTKSIASIVQSIQKQVSTSIQDNIMRGYFTDNVKEYSKSQCEEYLKNYPNGSFVNEVKQRLTSINEKLKKDEDFWNSNKNSIEGINRYKALFPNGIHITDIESQTKKNRERTTNNCPEIQNIQSYKSNNWMEYYCYRDNTRYFLLL